MERWSIQTGERIGIWASAESISRRENQMKETGIKRKVLSNIRWRMSTGYTRELTLECGHKRYQKGSIPIPGYCNCLECKRKNK